MTKKNSFTKKTTLISITLTALFLLLLGLPVYYFLSIDNYSEIETLPTATNYPENPTKSCQNTVKTGTAGSSRMLETVHGFGFRVHAPVNYKPQVAHPLIVVFAPATLHASHSEKYTGLIRAATEAGFIIAYTNSQKMSAASTKALNQVKKQIADQWCIDNNRIFYTGHSDGGTVSSALAFMPETHNQALGIAPSAAGISGKDFEAYPCPEPISVMVMHGENDSLFPDFGSQAIKWWASCNQCNPKPEIDNQSGCLVYADCSNEVITQYCSHPGSHRDWPHMNAAVIQFFNNAPTRPPADTPSTNKESL